MPKSSKKKIIAKHDPLGTQMIEAETNTGLLSVPGKRSKSKRQQVEQVRPLSLHLPQILTSFIDNFFFFLFLFLSM